MSSGGATSGNGSNEPHLDYPSMVAFRVAEVIPRLEAAVLAGTLEPLLDQPEIKERIGESLVARYRAIAEEGMKHDQVLRQSWTAVFVQALSDSLRPPTKIFPASEVRGGVKTPPLLVGHFQGDSVLRSDQVVSGRRWGIWFDFDSENLAENYSRYLVRSALHTLESRICNLRYIESTYLSRYSRLSQTARYDITGIGGRFEHLMLDVLNELAPLARLAPLAEDVLEKTDLRVAYPSIKRKYGARIQVSLVADRKKYSAKVEEAYLREELIHLTPIDLASAALSPPAGPLFQSFNWDEFWAALGGKSPDDGVLAQTLHDLFIDVLLATPFHPLGPIWLVPPPLREFIRVFTEQKAAETTSHVRDRELQSRRPIGSVRKFTRGRWKTRLSDPKEMP